MTLKKVVMMWLFCTYAYNGVLAQANANVQAHPSDSLNTEKEIIDLKKYLGEINLPKLNYDHGPLARTEIGDKQLQGFDYIYNLQGWMKGINAIENEKDPGQDGLLPNGTSNNPNALFAQDAGAFSLEYFNSDYQSISGSVPISTVASGSHPAANSAALYNGNIRYMQTRLTNINTHDAMPMLNAYKYDQLNRLNESRSYESGLASNVWNPSSYNNAYYNAFTYDAMGNILSQKRHNRAGTMLEDMTYQYHKLNNKLLRNRLYHINDAVSASVDDTDIDDQGTFDPLSTNINQNNNYKYDEEGRLVRDIAEDIAKITWRVDGKVKEIQRGADTSKRFIRFDYDAMGHRIAKHVYDNTGTILKKSTYYILDAQGNQISMYEHEVQQEMAEFNIVERNIFGSSRLGSRKDKINLLAQPQDSILGKRLGHKNYEFSNHLGNVLIVFTDVKTPLDTNSDGTVDLYRVCLQNIFDYSPFGAVLDGRTMQGDAYRYGFNGKESDNEVKGIGNIQDYGMRIYDPGLGKFLSVDPLSKEFPWNSTYAFAENDVVRSIDLDGLEKLIIHAQKMESVGGIKIDVQKADFIAYKLSFSIEYPDGRIEQLNTKEPVIMYENKSMQSGSKSANALKVGAIYDLEWGKMGSFKDEQIHIKSNGPGHSNKTFIHPLGTTAPADNNPKVAYTIGCKGVSCENSAEISADGKIIYGDEPFTYTESHGKTYVAEDQKANSSKSWSRSYKAMDMIRTLYNDNKDKLQKDDNFELKVE